VHLRLAAGSLLLFFGRVADLFGRRVVLLFGMTCYSACLLIAGFATNPVFLDIFCGLIGLCSAATVPAAVGTLGAAYSRPSRRKNIAFACFSAGNPLGFGAGALLSGLVNKSMTWRASFWILAVGYGLVSAFSWHTVPLQDNQPRFPYQFRTLARLDWFGALAIITGLALLLSGITYAPMLEMIFTPAKPTNRLAATAPYGWQTDHIMAFICFGIILMIGFVVWQGLSCNPLMPLHVWKDKNFSLASAAIVMAYRSLLTIPMQLTVIISFGYIAFSSNTFFLALLLQKIRHMSPLLVALHLLPQVVGGVLINIMAGLLMHRINNKLLISIGAVSYVLAFSLLIGMQEDSSYWAFIFPALCLSVVGADFEFTVTNMYVMSSLPVAQQSIAGGLFNTIMRLSSSVGLSVATAVFNGVDGSTPEVGQLSADYGKYRATFFVALAGTGLSLFLLPFLTIKTQGGQTL
jgi:MFS family permease